MKATTIRRIIGIMALVLWAVAIASILFLQQENKIIWQLDSWAILIAPILTMACMIEDSTFHATMFFQLDNGRRYNESHNDSLLALINNQKQ